MKGAIKLPEHRNEGALSIPSASFYNKMDGWITKGNEIWGNAEVKLQFYHSLCPASQQTVKEHINPIVSILTDDWLCNVFIKQISNIYASWMHFRQLCLFSVLAGCLGCSQLRHISLVSSLFYFGYLSFSLFFQVFASWHPTSLLYSICKAKWCAIILSNGRDLSSCYYPKQFHFMEGNS